MKYTDREARSARREAIRKAVAEQNTKKARPATAALARGRKAAKNPDRKPSARTSLKVNTAVASATRAETPVVTPVGAPPTPTSPPGLGIKPQEPTNSPTEAKVHGLGLRIETSSAHVQASAEPKALDSEVGAADSTQSREGCAEQSVGDDAAVVSAAQESPDASSSTSVPDLQTAADLPSLPAGDVESDLPTEPESVLNSDPTTDLLSDPMSDSADLQLSPCAGPSSASAAFAGSDLDTIPSLETSPIASEMVVPPMSDNEFQTYMHDLETSSGLSTPSSSGAASPVVQCGNMMDELVESTAALDDGLDRYIDYSATCDEADPLTPPETVHMKRRVPLCGYRDRSHAGIASLFTPNKRSVLAACWTVAPDMVVSTREAYMHSVMLAAASLNHRSMLSGRARQTMAPAMGTSH